MDFVADPQEWHKTLHYIDICLKVLFHDESLITLFVAKWYILLYLTCVPPKTEQWMHVSILKVHK